ncbi:hypothetical protein KL928_001465 [Ogataea angusta]|uniref:Uncharacterized protein n=1 Tax=Pichia angusta TaxID=870730 RepID=A0AAN6I6F8_PICAN|nr:uncharacterized protein KL928_001465 [Ogataea angusta]KAG7820028.1 hypothetical protein KL928_001465 [Ogataea angusta]
MNAATRTHPEYHDQGSLPPAASVDAYDDNMSTIQRAGLRQTSLSAHIQQQQKKKHRPKTMLLGELNASGSSPTASMAPPFAPAMGNYGSRVQSMASVGSASNSSLPYGYHDFHQPGSPYGGSQHSLPANRSPTLSGSPAAFNPDYSKYAPSPGPGPAAAQYMPSRIIAPGLRNVSPASPPANSANHAARVSISSALSFIGYSPKKENGVFTPDSSTGKALDDDFADAIDDDAPPLSEQVAQLRQQVEELEKEKGRLEKEKLGEQEKAGVLEQRVGRMSESYEALRSENEALKEQLEARNKIFESSHEEARKLQQKLDSANEEISSLTAVVESVVGALPEHIKSKDRFMDFASKTRLDTRFRDKIDTTAAVFAQEQGPIDTDDKVLDMFREEVRALSEKVAQLEKRRTETEKILKHHIYTGNQTIKHLAQRNRAVSSPAGPKRELKIIDIVQPTLSVPEMKKSQNKK